MIIFSWALLALGLHSTLAAPAFNDALTNFVPATGQFWYENIKHQGTSSYNSNPNYKVYRNVKDYGAKGDGVTDDTAAINAAFADGNRCADASCGSSSTLTPAVVYFPSGSYVISAPILPLYMTQMVGDPINMPTLKASSSFKGGWLIESDPYMSNGQQTYVSTDHFFVDIRNFELNMLDINPALEVAGIHWPVAQATSLINIVFTMNPGSKNVGLFIENGSGGWLSDLVFNGGDIGMNVGNQQFATRNITFNSCGTAINQIWDWTWTYSGLDINNCNVGIDMSVAAGKNQTVGSITLLDSTIKNTPLGIKTSTNANSRPSTSGTLYIENVLFDNTPIAVGSSNTSSILNGNTLIQSWGQGHLYSGTSNKPYRAQELLKYPQRNTGLLDASGAYLGISMPQFTTYTASQFASAKDAGAKGDGKTDDTAAIQTLITSQCGRNIVYFDSGSYVVSNTIRVPNTCTIVGEGWATIMATGSKFGNANAPIPVFQVGTSGASGNVQIVNMIFSNLGPVPGATMIEWNIHDSNMSSGMWNVHVRIGGTTGSQQLQCTIQPNTKVTTVSSACLGAFMLVHITPGASIYMENNWLWTADHNLDADHLLVSIFTGRGILIESQQPSLFWAVASEHNVFYQYQLNNASNIAMFTLQSETPYFQSNPIAPVPFTPISSLSDPDFANCNGNPSCAKAWGARILNSESVWIYGAGFYSFYDDYTQDCIATNNCQTAIFELSNTQSVYTYNLNTIASTSMVDLNGVSVVDANANQNVYPWTILGYN